MLWWSCSVSLQTTTSSRCTGESVGAAVIFRCLIRSKVDNSRPIRAVAAPPGLMIAKTQPESELLGPAF